MFNICIGVFGPLHCMRKLFVIRGYRSIGKTVGVNGSFTFHRPPVHLCSKRLGPHENTKFPLHEDAYTRTHTLPLEYCVAVVTDAAKRCVLVGELVELFSVVIRRVMAEAIL